MKTADLVFIGIRGSVVALNRATGEEVWATHLKGYDFVNIIVDEAGILATCRGEIYCLNPLTGDARWHNPLKGFGWGLATMATEACPQGGNVPLMAGKRRRDEQAAAASTAACA